MGSAVVLQLRGESGDYIVKLERGSGIDQVPIVIFSGQSGQQCLNVLCFRINGTGRTMNVLLRPLAMMTWLVAGRHNKLNFVPSHSFQCVMLACTP